ncbi:MAG: DUF4249 domain-containing protein [Bacteroidetes bacterium]|nr:DUF4249 domain-containing protein [Bacteroidota bacterium]HET6243547.1 DUF4249 domain-containing protein [Bacteroidia bacterium]
MLKKSLITLIVVSLSSSCQMIVTVDIPEHKPTLVVNSIIDPSETFIAHISNSLGVLDRASIKNVDVASVEVYENDVFLEKLEFIGEGTYISNDKKPISGNNYKIIVNAVPYDPIEASILIPQSVQVSNIVYTKSAYTDPNFGILSSISFSIHDPIGIKNYYATNVFFMDTLLYMGVSPVYIHTNDPAIESDSYGSTEILFGDDHFSGKEYRFEILFGSSELGYMEEEGEYELFLNFSSVSKEYFQYKTTLSKHMQTSGNPFAEPAPVYTNVQNGLGVFASKNSKIFFIQR